MFQVLISYFSVLECRVIKMMELINYLPGTCDELEDEPEDEPVFVEMLFNRSLVLWVVLNGEAWRLMTCLKLFALLYKVSCCLKFKRLKSAL